ncbi:antibiotic biosynthesis monooxygenase [Novosphingobium sp. 1949]|uniref:Antibiotic biosynthesis monooxygenase n=1 Tax=Novosphingobium organovorum TaxID=2930092 RepID=A0ABT0BIL6_9SPHN|nr:putative quinol monooxygenase [Novosphingobium organovorum]MCJ2184574.1 antibiotic biosynthesis monooxygenase [Novosphingobium organovorum]
MIVITGQFRMDPAPERAEAIRAALEAVIHATRAEKGCLAYSYAQDVLEPGLYRLTEIWESREDLAVHFTQPHMKVWMDVRPELGFTKRDLTLHETVSSEPF